MILIKLLGKLIRYTGLVPFRITKTLKLTSICNQDTAQSNRRLDCAVDWIDEAMQSSRRVKKWVAGSDGSGFPAALH